MNKEELVQTVLDDVWDWDEEAMVCFIQDIIKKECIPLSPEEVKEKYLPEYENF